MSYYFKLDEKELYDYLLIIIINVKKNLHGGSHFVEAIFLHLRKLFSKFSYKIFVVILLDIIDLDNFPVFQQIIIQNYHV